jgi:hypothetical protein
MQTVGQWGEVPRRQLAAWYVLLWALLSASMVAVGGPEGLRLLIAAPFALVGVGFAALIRLRDVSGAPGYALVLLVGVSSLILISMFLVYSGLGGSHLGLITIGVQGALAFLLVSSEAMGKGGQRDAAA